VELLRVVFWIGDDLGGDDLGRAGKEGLGRGLAGAGTAWWLWGSCSLKDLNLRKNLLVGF